MMTALETAVNCSQYTVQDQRPVGLQHPEPAANFSPYTCVPRPDADPSRARAASEDARFPPWQPGANLAALCFAEAPTSPLQEQVDELEGVGWDFDLPPDREAGEPPEARGLARDEVRLMVTSPSDDGIVHTQFRSLGDFLRPGDLLVVNTSGTLNAALRVQDEHGQELELHLSTHLPADLWNVELRLPTGAGTEPFLTAEAEARLRLPGGGKAVLLVPYARSSHAAGRTRLWIASLDLPCGVNGYLDRYGFPIRYRYVRKEWPGEYYQTVFATEKGSAEMPSAGRAFTPELVTQLVSRGVQFAPLLLHTGVASLESHEPPYEEYYRVPRETASMVNAARASDRRVIAVGTTVMRALETVTDETGEAHPGEGWTSLVITPKRGVRAATGLLTGFHEPSSTHLAILQAIVQANLRRGQPQIGAESVALAARRHLQQAYHAALEHHYLWHEFGDLHLILDSP